MRVKHSLANRSIGVVVGVLTVGIDMAAYTDPDD